MTITDQIIKALCSTLVYSLWQGIILAAVAGIIVIATRKYTSALRYNLLTGALALFGAGTIVTFITQFKLVHFAVPVAAIGNNVAFTSPIVAAPIVAVQSGNVFSVLSSYLDNYHNSIVSIWFLIICIKSIQFGVGLYGTYTLKRVSTFAPDQFWKERALQLACLLGVKPAINILESGLAKVPMVIGHLKPIILIPVGMFTALSPNQIEAIIIHELAHIKRRDYLVNMLQSLMEIIFFFNPAVLWISNLIKVERENCCDDIAVAQNGNKSNYIHALVSCEEFQSAIPAYAMAFPGNKNSLLNRVKRMANNRNNSLNQFEKAFLAICLVMSGLCLSAFAAKDKIKHTVHEVVKSIQHSTIYKAEQNLISQSAKLDEQAKKLAHQTALASNNKPALKDDATDTTKKHINVQAVPVVAPVVNVAPTPNVAPVIVVPQVNVNIDPSNAPRVAVAPVNVHVNTQVTPHLAYSMSTLAALNVAPHVNVSASLGRLGMLGKLNGNLNVPDTIRYRNSAYNRTFRQIVRELVKMKLVTDTNNVSVSLNEKELVVNGVKQPEDIRKTIYEKYGNNGPKFGYSYNNNNSNSYGNNYSRSYSSGSSSSNSNSNSNSYSYSSGSSDSSGGRATTRATAPRAATRPTSARTPTPAARSYSRAYNDRRDINEYNQQQMLDDLLNDKIITDKENLKLTLSTKEFTVNGKRQSEEIFQKYKKKFVPADAGSDYTWNYSHSNN